MFYGVGSQSLLCLFLSKLFTIYAFCVRAPVVLVKSEVTLAIFL
jgi:hypothetical protein